MLPFERLFQPLRLGPEVSPNRLGLAPINTGFIDNRGLPSRGFTEFHRLYASGGVGVVFGGGVAVSGAGRPSHRTFVLDSEIKADALKPIIRAIRQHGVVPVVQLMHAGRQADPIEIEAPVVAPSPLPCPIVGVQPVELSTGEIATIVDGFATAARLAKKGGVGLVELHAAHGYLLAEFLSPYSNKRVDRYGGSFAGRFRILSDTIEAIRSSLDMGVGVRISGDEFVRGGLSSSDLPELMEALQCRGVAYVSISAGVYSKEDRIMPPRKLGEAVYESLAERAKRSARVPVLITGNITSLASASRLLDNAADLILLGRALLADPLLIQKSVSGKTELVQPCTMCQICKYHSRGLPHVACPHNTTLKALLRETILEARAQGVRIRSRPLMGRDATYVSDLG